ncbi:MAG: tRNA (guanosine(37)-N1)-methyltransferase TrmD [Bacteroidota bacterium]
MRIDILTIFPEIFSSFLGYSIVKRAVDKKLAEIYVHNIRSFSTDKHRKVDDYAYGGGAGMVMTVQPVADAITKLKSEREYDEVIYLTPDGKRFDQQDANHLSTKSNLILLCGHYKGIDQRIRDIFITQEISIGDYVLTGGEPAAIVLADSIIRLIPGAISDETSALLDSFQDNLLAPPVYTRPADYKGYKVPDILLNGNNRDIEEWRLEQSLERTLKIRPDLLDEKQNSGK